jgi:hypothetical protein
MIFVYAFLLLFLGAIKMLIDRRVARLERKYSAIARAADALLREPVYKGGNSNKPDLALTAKRQYQLGLLVQKRDRLEAKHDAWNGLAERFRKRMARIRNWQGKLLPYTLGVLDVALILCLFDYFGLGDAVNVRNLVDQVASYMTR